MAVPELFSCSPKVGLTRIHVEHNAEGRSAAMHKVDPLGAQVSKRRKLVSRCVSKRPIWLGEAARP
jgi:hypothetical protein